MLVLCSMLATYYAHNYAGIIGSSLVSRSGWTDTMDTFMLTHCLLLSTFDNQKNGRNGLQDFNNSELLLGCLQNPVTDELAACCIVWESTLWMS